MRRLQVLAGIASAGLVAASLVMGAPAGAGASAIPAPAAAPTPAHLWHAEGNAADSVGADNGTLVGAGFGPGVLGPDQALSFAGGGQRVVFNKFGGNRRRGDFTLAFDIKTTTTRNQAIWEKRIACNSDGTPFWDFRMGPGQIAQPPRTGIIGFSLFTGQVDYFVDSTTSLNDGKWHLVVATRHGVTLSLYIDGDLEATTTSPTTVKVINDARMRAGVSKCDGIDGTHPFIGELDELMIFRTAFTQQQIQALGRLTG
jgi:hypothetical protein